MATTKPTDPTTQKQALTQEDVNRQDARTRLWQSLGYTFGNQLKQSNESYDKAIAQTYNDALRRGMQRSSYAISSAANLQNAKIKAQNEIGAAQIAEYQNRLGQIEQQEKEEEWRQKEFDANREDAAFSKDMQTKQFEEQKANTAWNQNFQQEQFAEQKANTAWTQDFQQKQADQSQANFQAQFDAQQKQQEFDNVFRQAQFDYQKLRDSITDAATKRDLDERIRQFNEQMAFQRERAAASDEQWIKDYQRTVDQFYAQLGLERDKFNYSKEQDSRAASSYNPGYPNSTPPPGNNEDNKSSVDAIDEWMNGGGFWAGVGNILNSATNLKNKISLV